MKVKINRFQPEFNILPIKVKSCLSISWGMDEGGVDISGDLVGGSMA